MVDNGRFAAASWRDAVSRCPKRMTHGPCAGVHADGACEVPDAGRCSFLAVDGEWPYPVNGLAAARPPRLLDPAAATFLRTAASRPVVVADLPATPLSADSLRATASVLAGAADACLLGDHGGARVQLPPSYRTRLLTEEGVPAWPGINCRDRNRVALEGEIAACVDAGAVGVHCVTGDHTALGHRADAAPVFDLDSLDVVGLAARAGGTLCSVAHAPAAPPTERRLSRLLAKIEAGADAVFVDHCGGPQPVADAVAELRAAGFSGLVLACVPVVTSAASASVVASFAGDRMPPGYLERITGGYDAAALAAGALSASPPSATAAAAQAEITAAGIDEGTELAEQMLEIPGVDGVNLSGGAPPGDELALARAMAEIARRVLGAPPPPGQRRSRGQARTPAGTT